jgi:hypothetical protein
VQDEWEHGIAPMDGANNVALAMPPGRSLILTAAYIDKGSDAVLAHMAKYCERGARSCAGSDNYELSEFDIAKNVIAVII